MFFFLFWQVQSSNLSTATLAGNRRQENPGKRSERKGCAVFETKYSIFEITLKISILANIIEDFDTAHLNSWKLRESFVYFPRYQLAKSFASMKRNPFKHENLIAFLHRIEFVNAFHCSTLKPSLLLGSDYGKKKITRNEIPTPFQIALPNIRQAFLSLLTGVPSE